ncbi:hypothetical protein HOD29_05895 [archaeon]|jgi:hypothetical protein|nr:hypothetical protein [archaeon]
MLENNLIVAVSFVQSIILISLLGVLVSEFFKEERKNKSDVLWFILLTVLWMIFMGFSVYGSFLGELSRVLSWIAIGAFFVLLVLFAGIIIRRFKFFNKILIGIEYFLLLVMFVIVLFDRHHYAPEIMVIMVPMAFTTTLLGYFIVIDFLIRSFRGGGS